jgi:hypothetical protein
VLADDAVELRERGLRAGVEPARTCRDHDALEEHAVVEPAALAHHAVDREHQADRRAEELVVAAVLCVHARLVGLLDAEQPVQVPADLAAPVDERRDPLGRVVRVLFRMGRAFGRVVVGVEDLARQLGLRVAGEHVDLPRLRVRARRGA